MPIEKRGFIAGHRNQNRIFCQILFSTFMQWISNVFRASIYSLPLEKILLQSSKIKLNSNKYHLS